MPRGSSPKRERQYEHIKESYEERGVSTDEAEERAARTVNKDRREAGETKTKKR
jgi:plasmid stabilization system protein ParE